MILTAMTVKLGGVELFYNKARPFLLHIRSDEGLGK
jgi:hypothetical protein